MRWILPKRLLSPITAIGVVLAFTQPGWSQSTFASSAVTFGAVTFGAVTFGAVTFDEEDYEAQILSYFYYSLYIVGAWVAGLVTLFTLGKLYSNLTLRSIEEADPNGATGKREISLRSRYKRLINVAGVYYYVSLPIVIFLVLAVAAAAIYVFFMIGRIPIKIVLIIGFAAVVTIYKMIRSLFIKIESADPGRALKSEEAPGLWELTREVAQAVGTRPIDEIRVTPGCDLAVYEKGGFREKLQDRARRILILGVGSLNGMRQNAFRAVLAHEYGHFSNRNDSSPNAMVWDLFASPESLTAEMSQLIDDRVKEATT
jgi:hypothetical protein